MFYFILDENLLLPSMPVGGALNVYYTTIDFHTDIKLLLTQKAGSECDSLINDLVIINSNNWHSAN